MFSSSCSQLFGGSHFSKTKVILIALIILIITMAIYFLFNWTVETRVSMVMEEKEIEIMAYRKALMELNGQLTQLKTICQALPTMKPVETTMADVAAVASAASSYPGMMESSASIKTTGSNNNKSNNNNSNNRHYRRHHCSLLSPPQATGAGATTATEGCFNNNVCPVVINPMMTTKGSPFTRSILEKTPFHQVVGNISEEEFPGTATVFKSEYDIKSEVNGRLQPSLAPNGDNDSNNDDDNNSDDEARATARAPQSAARAHVAARAAEEESAATTNNSIVSLKTDNMKLKPVITIKPKKPHNSI